MSVSCPAAFGKLERLLLFDKCASVRCLIPSQYSFGRFLLSATIQIESLRNLRVVQLKIEWAYDESFLSYMHCLSTCLSHLFRLGL